MRAPISGRISDRRVDAGNLISGGQTGATLLTVIVSIDPIHFVFDGSEADFLRYLRLAAAGARPSSRDVQNPVSVRLADESEYKHHGRMDFVDNVLNPRTGTIRGRAIFENKDGLLTPGFSAGCGCSAASTRRCWCPTARSRPISRARSSSRSPTTARSASSASSSAPSSRACASFVPGLAPTDRIVIDGLQRARPGQKVKPEDGKIEAWRPVSARRTLSSETAMQDQGSVMRFSHFFIDRPIFAGVISILLTLVGAIPFRALPITEFPDIAPPTSS